MKWARHMARMGDRTDACRVLVWIREGDLEDLGIDGENIKMEPQEVGFRGGDMDWIDLA